MHTKSTRARWAGDASAGTGWRPDFGPQVCGIPLLSDAGQKSTLNAAVRSQLWMKRGDQVTPGGDEHRIAHVPRQHAHAGTAPANDRRTDEDRFHIAAVFEPDPRHRAVDLPSIGIALDADVHQSERFLFRM